MTPSTDCHLTILIISCDPSYSKAVIQFDVKLNNRDTETLIPITIFPCYKLSLVQMPVKQFLVTV